MRRSLVLLPLLLLVFSCSSKKDSGRQPSACEIAQGRVVFFDAKTAKEADVQKAFVGAQFGDVLQFGEGTFALQNGLVIATDCVSVRGAGMDKTVLDFAGQPAGSEGIYGKHANDFEIQNLTVHDTKGSAVKALGCEGVTFRKVKAEWTGADASTHGAFGLYAAESKRVLIEECVATDASDSGLSVSQSDTVVLRRNRVERNVAGIKIENTFNADVHENIVSHNTAGILVLDLPGVPQLGGHNIRVFQNTIKENNTKNFASKANIVGLVPAGVGFFVMANHDVEAFSNTLNGNVTANSAVVSYIVSQLEIKDANYYPYPERVFLHDNVYIDGGNAPDTSRDLGMLLAQNKDKFPDKVVPQILYDGVLDGKKTTPAGNTMQLCLKHNSLFTRDATFINMHLDKLPPKGLDLSPIASYDAKPYDCMLPPLPQVTWTDLAR